MRLKEIRIERGVSQIELARRMGVSQSYVAKIEARSDASVALVRRYIEALGGELGASWSAGDQSKPVNLDELLGVNKLRDLAAMQRDALTPEQRAVLDKDYGK